MGNGQTTHKAPAGAKEGWFRRGRRSALPPVAARWSQRIALTNDSVAPAGAFHPFASFPHGLRRGLESGRRCRGCIWMVESSAAGPREGVGSLSRPTFSKWLITAAKDCRLPCAAPRVRRPFGPQERASFLDKTECLYCGAGGPLSSSGGESHVETQS